MNLTDLRDELDLHVSGLEADTSAISAGIARKVRSTKRRRAAGAVGGLCAAVLAAGLVLTNQPGRAGVPVPAVTTPTVMLGADGMPSRTIPDSAGDVVKDGLRFRAQVAEDVLAAGVIGDLGQSSLSLTWVPTTRMVSFSLACSTPFTTTSPWHPAVVEMRKDGHVVSAAQCSDAAFAAGDLPTREMVLGEPGQGFSDLVVGRSTSLTVTLVDERTRKPIDIDDARVVAAVYEMPPDLVVENEVGKAVAALPDNLEHQGYVYAFRGLTTAPVDSGTVPVVETPSGTPFLVTYGSAGVGRPGEGRVTIEGLGGETSEVGYGGWTTVPQPARGPGSVTLKHLGPVPSEGTRFIAIYTLAP